MHLLRLFRSYHHPRSGCDREGKTHQQDYEQDKDVGSRRALALDLAFKFIARCSATTTCAGHDAGKRAGSDEDAHVLLEYMYHACVSSFIVIHGHYRFLAFSSLHHRELDLVSYMLNHDT
jgi:hypothetical protein